MGRGRRTVLERFLGDEDARNCAGFSVSIGLSRLEGMVLGDTHEEHTGERGDFG